MRKTCIVLISLVTFYACNTNGTINEQKIDAAGDKLKNTVEKAADSISNKVERFADSLDRRDDTLR